MSDDSRYSLSYNWGEVTKYTPDLRSHELVARVKWFISMRWLAILVCAVGALAALLEVADDLEQGRPIDPLSGKLGEGRQRPSLAHRVGFRILTSYFNDKRALVGVIRGIPDLEVSEDDLRRLPVPLCSIIGSRGKARYSRSTRR